VARANREGRPAGGWRREEALTIEEAVRGWTSWAPFAGFRDQQAGTIGIGRNADLTVMDIDPFQAGETAPARLLAGRVVMTIVNGRIVYQQ
jgi:hypothetical protein